MAPVVYELNRCSGGAITEPLYPGEEISHTHSFTTRQVVGLGTDLSLSQARDVSISHPRRDQEEGFSRRSPVHAVPGTGLQVSSLMTSSDKFTLTRGGV